MLLRVVSLNDGVRYRLVWSSFFRGVSCAPTLKVSQLLGFTFGSCQSFLSIPNLNINGENDADRARSRA